MASDQLIIGPADLLVKINVRSAAQTAALRIFVENAANEKRIIADVRAKQKSLLWCGAGERNQHVGNVCVTVIVDLVRGLQSVRARKSLQERSDIITEFSIDNFRLLQDAPGEHVEIKLRRNVEVTSVAQDRVNQAGMVENGIARFRIGEKIDK